MIVFRLLCDASPGTQGLEDGRQKRCRRTKFLCSNKSVLDCLGDISNQISYGQGQFHEEVTVLQLKMHTAATHAFAIQQLGFLQPVFLATSTFSSSAFFNIWFQLSRIHCSDVVEPTRSWGCLRLISKFGCPASCRHSRERLGISLDERGKSADGGVLSISLSSMWVLVLANSFPLLEQKMAQVSAGVVTQNLSGNLCHLGYTRHCMCGWSD